MLNLSHRGNINKAWETKYIETLPRMFLQRKFCQNEKCHGGHSNMPEYLKSYKIVDVLIITIVNRK